MTDKHKEQILEGLRKILAEFIGENIKGAGGLKYVKWEEKQLKPFLDLLDKTQQATIKQIKINIGFLRQWLNERTSDKLLTNEDLETWLLDKLKKEGG